MFRKVPLGHMVNQHAISNKYFAFLQLIEQHKKASLPSSSLAEVYLVMGNMKDDLGLFADAQQLWQEALDIYQQECSALSLKERQVQLACCWLYGVHRCLIAAQICNIKRRIDKRRIESQETIEVLYCALLQAHPELRNLYTVHTEGLIHALMRKSVSLLRQQQAPAAVEAAQQAFAMVQQLRCLPLLQAQAAALLGHCCTVHSHLINDSPAAGSLSAFVTSVPLPYYCWIA